MTQSLKEKIEEVLSCIPLDTQAGEKEVNELVSIFSSELDRVLKGVRRAIEDRGHGLHFAGALKEEKGVKEALSAFDRSVEELRK